MSSSGSAGTGVDPETATERLTVETTSRTVKKTQNTPEPKAKQVLARATQATERAQVAVHRSRAHARSRRAAVRELLTAVTIKSTVTIKTEEVAMERASWTSWMRAGRVERESGTGCARRGLERERFLKTNKKSRLSQRFGLGSLLALSRSWGRSRSRESPRR